MRLRGKLVMLVGALFVLAQLIRPTIPAKPATAEVQAPAAVRQILNRSCYSCHSDERRLAWFDEIEPGYLLVRHDILNARARLNFSTLGSEPAAAQRATLFEAVNMIQFNAMPLRQFVALHPDAKVRPEELAEMKAYLAPWRTAPGMSTGSTKGDAQMSRTPLSSVRPEPNGVAFDPSFEGWKLVSTTDRGDNNTFRFILANDVAMKAIESGSISPWPDGTRFAKVAWQQELGEGGLVHPGKFIQVELMIKDARLYKATEGWGWGRWRGLDLKPYGEDSHFVSECTGCHLPMRGDDYVYTLPISQAVLKRGELMNHAAAALLSGLPWHPLAWQPITMYVDPKSHTTATLFGNAVAIHTVRARAVAASEQPIPYPARSVLALVTWVQRDDPHWFGGRIPDTPQAIEFLTVSSDPMNNVYRSFSGPGLVERQIDGAPAAERKKFLLGLPPPSLP